MSTSPSYLMSRQLLMDESVIVHDQWGQPHQRIGVRGDYYVQFLNHEYGLIPHALFTGPVE